MTQYTVLFVPERVSVDVEHGTTILAAARMGGVFVHSLCGGDGVCGKCKVILRLGQAGGGSTDLLTREEIRQGYTPGESPHGSADPSNRPRPDPDAR